MKNNLRIIISLVFTFTVSSLLYAQDKAMHTQGVMKQEFLNPAYNSFKDYVSLSLFSREQWGNKVIGSPSTYAANLYVPLKKSNLGVGLIAIAEKIGLREKTTFVASLSHNVRITQNSYLAFGYGLGIESTSYDKERLIAQDPTINVGAIDLNYSRTNLSIGLFYYSPRYFVGLGSNTLVDKQRVSGEWFLPGFDFTVGSMHRLHKNILFRPDLVIKYYHIRDIEYNNEFKTVSYFNPIYDLNANFLLDDKVWLGIGHRFQQAQTFSVDVIISKKFKLGYTYELGIGSGLNQFSSQGIRVTWGNFSDLPRSLASHDEAKNLGTTGYLYK